MGQGLLDRRRSRLQNVCDAHMQLAIIQPDQAIRVSELAEFHPDAGHAGSGLQFRKSALKDGDGIVEIRSEFEHSDFRILPTPAANVM